MRIMKYMFVIVLLSFFWMADGVVAQIAAPEKHPLQHVNNLANTRAGTFLGVRYAGFDVTYLPAGSPWYVGGYTSALLSPDMRADNVSRFHYAGLTFGRQFYFNDPNRYAGNRPRGALVVGNEKSNFIFYAKLGSGFGLGFVKELDRLGTYFGLNGQGVVGVMKPLPGRGSIYLEVGNYMQYLPAYSRMRFTGGPNVTIGFQFAGSRM